MNIWSFADAVTGIFDGRGFAGSETRLEVNTPPGMIAVKGRHDHLSTRVDPETGELVDYQPPAPADNDLETWSWDDAARRWVSTPTAAAHWRRVREERDRRLRESDWRVIAATERAERPSKAWLDYRQALRDITTQPDPLAIQWPEKPE